jgi:cytochrome b561
VKDQRYTAKLSGMTIGLHWLLAIAMIGMLAFGLPRGHAKG